MLRIGQVVTVFPRQGIVKAGDAQVMTGDMVRIVDVIGPLVSVQVGRDRSRRVTLSDTEVRG